MLTFKQRLANRLGVGAYLGEWDASSNTPSISSGVGQTNGYYIISVAGSSLVDGESSWGIGDWVYFNGTEWKKIDNSELVEVVDSMSGSETDKAPSVSSVKNYITTTYGENVACSASNTMSQTIQSNATVKIQFDSKLYTDTHNAFNLTLERFVAPVEGWYILCCSVAYSVNGTGARALGYSKNGTSTYWMSSYQASSGDFTRCIGTAMVYLNVNDYIELSTYQNSGGNLTLLGGANNILASFHKF